MSKGSIIALSIFLITSLAMKAEEPLSNLNLSNLAKFRFHEITEPVVDQSWLTSIKLSGTPAPSRSYVAVSRNNGIAFYVTVAVANNINNAKKLFESYCNNISINTSNGTNILGAEEIMRFGERHLVIRVRTYVVGIFSSAEAAPADIPSLLETLTDVLQKQ